MLSLVCRRWFYESQLLASAVELYDPIFDKTGLGKDRKGGKDGAQGIVGGTGAFAANLILRRSALQCTRRADANAASEKKLTLSSSKE